MTALLGRLTVNRVVMTFDWGWIAYPRLLEFVPYFLSGVLAYAFWRRGGRTVPFWMFACVLGALATAYPTLLEIGAPGRSITVFSIAAIGFGLGILLPRVREPVWHATWWPRAPPLPAIRSASTDPRSLHLVRLRCAGGAAWPGAMGGLSGFARDHLLVPLPVCGDDQGLPAGNGSRND